MLKLSHIWPVGAPPNWFLCPLDVPYHYLNTYLLSATRYSRLILYFALALDILPRNYDSC